MTINIIYVALLCVPLLILDLKLSRREGDILFMGYVAYFIYTLS
ncbi:MULTISPECIES: hypothetical protein [Pseudoalteromonas]|nr:MULTISPECIES: hypothetical protein [unclassified Pseudoalteromonas]AUJ69775.1 hypothetical protein PNC201_07385 [Pseudoalteromonas sp. NC201]MCX2765714.1 hypothetical protein [Pseudoalteromonas sp. B530]